MCGRLGVVPNNRVCGWLGVVPNNHVCKSDSEISVCVDLTFVRGGVENF